jgi:cyclase
MTDGRKMVKTVRFRDGKYLGDPRNAIKIFNEREVDEIVVLDIGASRRRSAPDYEFLRELVSEAFMPLGYGGGVSSVEQARQLVKIGLEKVIVGNGCYDRIELIAEISRSLGRQSTVAAINTSKSFFGTHQIAYSDLARKHRMGPAAFARAAEQAGAGEIIVSSVDRDGTMTGYDYKIVREVAEAVSLPVVAMGGAGSLDDIRRVFLECDVSAAGAGSIFVYYGRHNAVLINYPDRKVVDELTKLPSSPSVRSRSPV